MNKSTSVWLHGLLAAIIGGAAGALQTGLGVLIVAPEKFQVGPQLFKTLATIFVFALFTALAVAAAYLKQSPLPAESVEITATQTQTTKVTATPTDETKG